MTDAAISKKRQEREFRMVRTGRGLSTRPSAMGWTVPQVLFTVTFNIR